MDRQDYLDALNAERQEYIESKYDFEGNVYGSAPNLEYAKNHCEFFEESK